MTRKAKRRGPERRRAMYEQARGRCAVCGERLDPADFTVDHIVPLCRGGSDRLENLQPTHRACNRRKGALTMVEWERHQSTAWIEAILRKRAQTP